MKRRRLIYIIFSKDSYGGMVKFLHYSGWDGTKRNERRKVDVTLTNGIYTSTPEPFKLSFTSSRSSSHSLQLILFWKL